MSDHRMKVLQMLAEGKVTAEEAERLLERLEAVGAAPAGSGLSSGPERPGAGNGTQKAADRAAPKRPKFLRVVIHSGGGEQVNVRVPLALLRTGIRLAALLPQKARVQLDERGVDLSALSEMDPDELVEAIAALTLDMDGRNGESVRIFCE